MSMTDEKYRAVCRAGFFLESVLYDKKIPESTRKSARMILRHFPRVIEMYEIFKGRESEKIPKDYWEYMIDERKHWLVK